LARTTGCEDTGTAVGTPIAESFADRKDWRIAGTMHPDSHIIFLVSLMLALMVLGPPVVGAVTGTIIGALHSRKVQQPPGPAKMKGAIIGGLIGIAVVFVGWRMLSIGI